MTKSTGREFLIKKGGTTIAAARTKGLNWSGNLIDTTTADDSGDTSYLANVFASTTMEVTIDGLLDSDVLPDLAFSAAHADKHFSDLTIELPNGDAISGDFAMTGMNIGAPHDDATTFSATIVRNGTHTLTPAV